MDLSLFYNNYKNSKANFSRFHNEVINMPRDHFSIKKLAQLRSVSAYLANILDDLKPEGNSYKQILGLLIDKQREGKYPHEKFRDVKFEQDYLITNVPLNKLYYDKDKEHPEKGGMGVGRMFRHIMELCEFFGLIYSISKQKKKISRAKCEQMLLAEDSDLVGLFRNYLINTNISSNTYIKNMRHVPDTADYNPTKAILQYVNEMKRPCTTFEISILLGRIDKLYDNNSIMSRALNIGKLLPANALEQQKVFFESMGWVNPDGTIFQYRASQQPEFKFNVYFLCMEQLGLLIRDIKTQTLVLTQYSNDLLSSSIPIEFTDLEHFAYTVSGAVINEDADNDYDSDLIDSLFKYDDEFKYKVKNDSNFVVQLNKYALSHPIKVNGKKVRNKLVAEASKILANYTDQITDKPVFLDRKGNPYCEAHHLLEFSTEEGPDITDNLVVLSPNNHICIHRGSLDSVYELYDILRNKGIISVDKYINMIKTYHCLTKKHIQILFEKHMITKDEYNTLKSYVV